MRFIKFAVLAALFALPVSSADAGILSSILTLNGTADQVNTINNPVGLSGFVDANENGEFDAGDIVFGFIASTQVTNDIVTSDPFNPNSPVGIGSGTPAAFGPNEYLAAVFSGVVNDGADPGQTFLTAVDPTESTGFSIPELFPDFADASEQLDGVDNAVVAVVSGSTANGVNDLTNTNASDLSTFFTDADFELEFALGRGRRIFSVFGNPTGGSIWWRSTTRSASCIERDRWYPGYWFCECSVYSCTSCWIVHTA